MYIADLNFRETFPQIEGNSVTAYRLYDENGHIGHVAFEWVNFRDVVAHLEFDRFSLSVARQVREHWESFKNILKEEGMDRLCVCITEDMTDVEKWKKLLKILKLNPPEKFYISVTEV